MLLIWLDSRLPALNKKWILYGIESLYLLALLYHALILGTLSRDLELQEIFRLGLGAVVIFGSAALARYWTTSIRPTHRFS